MALSDKQKEKIKEDEAKRLEEEKYRDKVKRDLKKGPWWKPRGIGAWIVTIVIAWIIFINVVNGFGTKNGLSTKSSPTPTPGVSQAAKDTLAQTFCSERSRSGFKAVNLDDFIAMYNAKGSSVTLHNANGVYPTQESCKKIVDLCLSNWSQDECQNIAGEKVWIGMDKDALILSWGVPSKRNDTVTAAGISTQWVYGDYGPYVYLGGTSQEDLKVTSWQNNP